MMENIRVTDDVEVRVKQDILNFLLAGRCTTTIQSSKTGKKYTYMIHLRRGDREKSNNQDKLYFINVAYDYMKFEYAGLLKVNRENGIVSYSQGKSGKCSVDAPSIKGLTWLINRELQGKTTEGLIVYHLGQCAKCGRPLTDPVSIEYGLGPTCRKYSKR